jgi:multiple sugar transport system permease protein
MGLSRNREDAERRLWILGTVVPALLLLIIISYFPIIYAVFLSFVKKTAFSPDMTWTGLKNYLWLLAEPDLWSSLVRSIVFTVGSVLLQIICGLVMALLLNRSFRGQSLARSLVILPYLLPTIVVGLVFKWLLNQDYGAINQVLLQWKLVEMPINFFGGLNSAMYSIIATTSWQYTSFVVLMILARLQAISPKLYEAAKVSGAGPIRCFLDVTLPNLKTTLFLLALLRGIWMFNKFDLIYIITGGGPLKATETLPIYAYRLAFEDFDFGKAAAACTIMFLVLALGSVIYFKLFDPSKEVEVGR